MSKQIVFKVDREGNVAVDKVTGYGSSCVEATSAIEKALGAVREDSRKYTEEYNRPVDNENDQQIEI